MSYFERIEQQGQLNIFHYLSLDELNINEMVTFQDVKITRQKRFFEVETNDFHEVAASVEEALGLLIV